LEFGHWSLFGHWDLVIGILIMGTTRRNSQDSSSQSKDSIGLRRDAQIGAYASWRG
jgi:hypothetical protein